MRSWVVVPVLAALCCLLLGAADFYARVPLQTPTYTDLKQLSTAGLLTDWQGPQYALLRLEVAMLLQTALPKYYEAADSGGTVQPETLAALKRLTHDYGEELAGLGIEVREPLGSAPAHPAAKPADPPSSPKPAAAAEPERFEPFDPMPDAPDRIPVQPAKDEVMLEVGPSGAAAALPDDELIVADSAAPATAGSSEPWDSAQPLDVTASQPERSVAPPPAAKPTKPAPAPTKPAPAPAKPAAPNTKPAQPKPAPAKPSPPPPLQVIRPAPPRQRPRESATTDVVITHNTPSQPSQPATPLSERTVAQPPALVAEAATPQPLAAPAPAPQPAAAAAPSGERDVNLLLSRRNEELGTVAAAVDRTGHPPLSDYVVHDSALGPVQPYDEELPVNVKVFGDLRGQAYWRDTGKPLGGSNAAGLRLYWADAGVDFSHEPWSARVTLNYNDGRRQLKLHELWGQYQSPDGVYARAGRVILPFASRKGDFPTFSSARQLGFSSVNGAGIGWNKPGWGGSAWLYDPASAAASSGSANLHEFAVSLNLFQADSEDDSAGWRVALAYLSDLGGSEHPLATGALTQAVPALALATGWDWGCGRYHVNLDYVGATRHFAAANLDANGDGRGDLPQALSLELLMTPDDEQMYGLRFEHTSGYAGAPANRWSAMYGKWLSDQLLARLEVSRGQYNDYTPSKRHDLALTADVRLVF